MSTIWLKTIYCTTEWEYINILPAIFVEQLIEPEPGKEILNYSFYLSEITIYPNGGQDNRPTSDDGYNRYLGRHWKMSFWHWLQAQKLECQCKQKKRQ
jgi:hypothetical protein